MGRKSMIAESERVEAFIKSLALPEGIKSEVPYVGSTGITVKMSAPLQPSVWVEARRTYSSDVWSVRLNCGSTGDGDIAKARGLVELLNAALSVADYLERRIHSSDW